MVGFVQGKTDILLATTIIERAIFQASPDELPDIDIHSL
jgi:late competence protein required for DNA uptake (superfamily II DNA/RNA helicase)